MRDHRLRLDVRLRLGLDYDRLGLGSRRRLDDRLDNDGLDDNVLDDGVLDHGRFGLDDDRLDGLEDLDDRLDDDRLGLLHERNRRYRLGRLLDTRRELTVEGRRRWCGRSVRLGRRRHLDVPQRPPSERALAELVPADLPAHLRELVDEDDLARDLLVGERLRGVLAKLRLELLRSAVALRDHECPDEVAASLEVADADDCSRGDRGMAVENALDVVRAERPAARRDDVLGAADEREVPLVVDVGDVAGEVPVAEEGRLRLLGKLPVARRRAWGAVRGSRGRLRCRSAARCPGRR